MLSEDGTGQSVSTMRVVTLLVVVAILAPRVVLAIKTGTIPNLTTEEVSALLGTLGIKAYQRGQETKPELTNSK